ncbi:UDP-2,4-diacetamido-2,4,6-trideoxy-beta-L-altropyranose hydrolase [Azospirillum sp. RWY-5-1]|uniref:UDP-2,4-diacetamido-2,4, 6-trideoxy-beta-L-altropyranose hydrolase n=1 Tax=Azospirillum oleiclasticum TaxID=2735135 RepID=A0ABX2TDY8_9PROT|nr:UDP-2,4-diacetamido-2,4,6-trideoxy-beta-L-altropyranose hydrolase [Azospirillum oleiclasticum]NYZ15430.1 UDP-2,4-diacetamido-2,4,6-trideoxy-beta-L-altropyranose hydrolase [Azospirillum oleiclasticum]NYZ22453.1 UDP-2,4-diacetamido-2,4,6-trideoxy-beta-L-altropyranose hydrolase [Azospirillum oleiclasticum]
MSRVLVRADAAPDIGTGHVMRCLAVAEALADLGHDAVFAMARSTPAIDRRLDSSGFRRLALPGPPAGAADCEATVAAARGALAVILDGYGFDETYRAGLRRSGARVAAFDDLADRTALHADVVVNPAPQAGALPYATIAHGAVLLLGPAYAALRREVREAASAPRCPLQERRAVLVTFGGSDPLGLTLPCVERLAAALPGDVRLLVAVGGSTPDAAAILRSVAGFGARVEPLLDTPAMGNLMARAGLAVSAAGGTTAELCALGVPTVLVTVADNQAPAAAEVGAAGWCLSVDGRSADAAGRITGAAVRLWHDFPERLRMTEATRRLVDGQGAMRIARAILSSAASMDARILAG